MRLLCELLLQQANDPSPRATGNHKDTCTRETTRNNLLLNSVSESCNWRVYVGSNTSQVLDYAGVLRARETCNERFTAGWLLLLTLCSLDPTPQAQQHTEEIKSAAEAPT